MNNARIANNIQGNALWYEAYWYIQCF